MRPARPVPVQLPLFAEAASLIRVRPELNEWRFYRMEVWPDLFSRALLLRQWGRIGTKDAAGSIRIPIREPPLTPSPRSFRRRNAGGAIGTRRHSAV